MTERRDALLPLGATQAQLRSYSSALVANLVICSDRRQPEERVTAMSATPAPERAFFTGICSIRTCLVRQRLAKRPCLWELRSGSENWPQARVGVGQNLVSTDGCKRGSRQFLSIFCLLAVLMSQEVLVQNIEEHGCEALFQRFGLEPHDKPPIFARESRPL